MNLSWGSPQFHCKVPRPAVLYRVSKGFLQHSEKAKRGLRWQSVWHIVALEVSLHILLCPELLAQAFHGGRYTQIFQLRRVQLMRQGLDIDCNLRGIPLQFSDTASRLDMEIGNSLRELV